MSLLELRAVSKSFGGTPALRDISFSIASGGRVGLIGENGAGKSTLIRILSGVHAPDAGEILWEGRPVRFGHPINAIATGISTIHQELAYFEKLTVTENLMMGDPWPRNRWGGTNWRKLNMEARHRLGECGLDLDPAMLFQKLSAAQRQEVAIARALARDAKLLILDEPSASLTEPEVERLFAHLERLRDRRVALIYVSHRLDEVIELTDHVIVLRDGALVAQYPARTAAVPQMIRDMIGRELKEPSPPAARPVREETCISEARAEKPPRPKGPGTILFEARELTLEPLFRNISFRLRAGEVVGFGGLIGAGRSEIARAIFGLYRCEGEMIFRGKPYAPRNPGEARERGVVYVPEERKRQGFVLEHTLREGISAGFLRQVAAVGVIRRGREKKQVESAVSRFLIHARGLEQPVGALSGGNQQKALLARWLETGPELVILDEPTRGVDVGAKAQIHELIRAIARQGKGVLLISSDLPELLSLSDCVLVLREGKIAAEMPACEASQERILLAASGFDQRNPTFPGTLRRTPKNLHAGGTPLS